jgi:hypothetical protein
LDKYRFLKSDNYQTRRGTYRTYPQTKTTKERMLWQSLPQSDAEASGNKGTAPVETIVRVDHKFTKRQRNLFLFFSSFALIFLLYLVATHSPRKNDDSIDGDQSFLNNNLVQKDSTKLSPEDILLNELLGGEKQQEAKVVLNANAESLLASVKENCANWDSALMERFELKCKFWLNTYADWLSKADIPGKHHPVGYECADEHLCHGLGDRLAGVQGSFSVALETGRPFRIKWNGMDRLFESCVFKGKQAGAWGTETSKGCSTGRGSCVADVYEANQCKQTALMFDNSDRGCLPAGTCSIANKAFPDTLTAANIYGCGLRALFEPSKSLLEYKVPLRDGANGVKRVSFADAQAVLSKYYVIGIHFRIGDNAAFFHPGSREVTPDHSVYLTPFQCAMTIQSHLEQRPIQPSTRVVNGKDMRYVKQSLDEEFTVGGKPVRWFLASDSNSIREMAVQLFGDKLLMIETRPSHLALKQGDRSSILADTFAEWFLLGLSDSLVVNRIGGKNLYRGRLSSFSKTTWAYQLKNIFYDAGSCRRRQILLDGTWKVAPKECTRGYSFHHKLSQPHLDDINVVLPNLTFPVAWVDRGRVSVLDPKLLETSGAQAEDDTPDQEAEPDDDEPEP